MTPAEKSRIVEGLAQEVMGWVHVKGNIWATSDGHRVIVGSTGWDPLTEIADAMEALRRWKDGAKGRGWTLTSRPRLFLVTTQGCVADAIGNTEAETICLALCKATGGEEEG